MNKNMLASVKNMLKDGPVKVSEVKKALKVKAKLDAFTQELMDAGFYVKKQGRAWMVTGISICVTYEEEDGLVTCSSNAIAIEPEPETDMKKGGNVSPSVAVSLSIH